MNEEMFPEIFNKISQAKQYILDLRKDPQNAEKAKSILLTLLEDYKHLYTETNTIKYLDFTNSLEFVITNNFYDFRKTVRWTKFPISTIYFYLQYLSLETRSMEDFLEYTKKGVSYAPLKLAHRFEFIESLKNQSQIRLFKEETLKLHKNIFLAEDLAYFYRNLGFYYSDKKYWDIAFALYSLSLKYQPTKNAYQEIEYIKNTTKNTNFYLSDEKIYNLLDDFNIPIGLYEPNMKLLEALYEKKDEISKEFQDFNLLLSNTLFFLTKNEKYMLYDTPYNHELGLTFKFPYIWQVEKTEIQEGNEKTLFKIKTDKQSIIEIKKSNNVGELSLKDACYINSYKCEENGFILVDSKPLIYKTETGPQEFVRLVFQTIEKSQYSKVEYITIINEYIFKLVTVVKNQELFPNEEYFNAQPEFLEIFKIISMLKEDKTNKKKKKKLVKQSLLINDKMYEFNIPDTYPPINKTRDNLYKIGDNLTIFVINNKSNLSLMEASKNWINFNYQTSGFKPLNEMETYNKGRQEIIKRYSKYKNESMRIYKFTIINEAMLVFAYNYDNNFLNETVDKIIETLTESD